VQRVLGELSVIYFPTSVGVAARARRQIRKAVPSGGTLRASEHSSWAQFQLAGADESEAENAALSLSATWKCDCFGVSAVSTVDYFAYVHACDGRVKRRLCHCAESEPAWSRVEGDPETWESRAFFDGARANRHVEHLSESDRELHRSAQQEGKVVSGRRFPSVSIQHALVCIKESFELPGLVQSTPKERPWSSERVIWPNPLWLARTLWIYFRAGA
jgi:hypothetical protein